MELTQKQTETILWTMLFSFAYEDFKCEADEKRVITKLLKSLPNNGLYLLNDICTEFENGEKIYRFKIK